MVLLWALIAGMAKVGGLLGRLARPRWVNAFFGKAQIVSAAYMGFAHGHNDAQKTMGIIAMTLIGAEAAGALNDLPGWLGFLHPDAHAGDGIAMWIVLTCVGFAKNPRSLKFGVIERIIWAWILTIPAAGGCAYLILKLFEMIGWA